MIKTNKQVDDERMTDDQIEEFVSNLDQNIVCTAIALQNQGEGACCYDDGGGPAPCA